MPREKSASSEGLRRSSRVSDGLGSQGSLYCTQEPNEPDVIEGAAPLIRAVGGDSTEGGAGGEIQSAADSGKATKVMKEMSCAVIGVREIALHNTFARQCEHRPIVT